MDRKVEMEQRLIAALAPERMLLVNDSGMHSVPAGSQTHWNLILVSQAFEGSTLVQRHRKVYDALGAGYVGKNIHALTLKTLTPLEWEAAGGNVTNPAPPCRGGSKSG